MNARFAAAAALTLAAATAAGCGGDDGPSKAEFVKRADAICAKASKDTTAKAQQLTSGGRPDKAALTKFIKETALPGVEKEADQIDQLDTPKGDGDKVKAITDAVRDGVDKTKSNPSALLSSSGSNGPFGKADKLAQDYGLKKCGSE
jgi:hypothetical protein